MIKKRSFFKVMDPILQRDTYLLLAAAWFIWTVAQAAFLVFLSWTMELETGGAASRSLIIGFLMISGLMMLLLILTINTLLSRVTGPIHRLKEDLEAARREGRTPAVKLRKNDYFQDLAESINSAMAERNAK